MTRGRPRVVLSHRSSHHAGPSGNTRLPEHIHGAITVSGVRSFVPYRIRRALTPVRGSGPLYDSNSLAKEVAAVGAVCRRPTTDGVVHYLDGERDVGPAVTLLRPTRWRTIATFHLPPAQILALPARRAFAHLDAAIALATTQIEVLEHVVGPGRVHHIPYGVDTTFFTPPTTDRPPDRLLFVGHHLRDFDLLADAGEELHRRFPRLVLTAITLPTERRLLPERPWLRVRTGLTDVELRAEYRSATALILPMTDAVACTALLEAMACGLPSVITDVGGGREYLPETAGRFVAPGRAEDLVEITGGLLRGDEDLDAMGAAARVRSLDLDWRAVAARVESLYDELPRTRS